MQIAALHLGQLLGQGCDQLLVLHREIVESGEKIRVRQRLHTCRHLLFVARRFFGFPIARMSHANPRR